MKRNQVSLICANCGTPFTRCPSQVSRCCSPVCGYAARREAVADRFWKKVSKPEDPKKCWLWQGSFYPDGYGQFKIGDRNRRASRVSYELSHGSIQGGLHVLHHCDTPACVRPDHLFLGTIRDNARNMMSKGRGPTGTRNGAYTKPESVRRGENNGRSKLTWDEVRAIRAEYANGNITQRAIAIRSGVSQRLVSLIVQHKIWKEVSPCSPH